MKTRWKQMQLASRIHGGPVRMFGAYLGVQLSRVPIPGESLRVKVFRSIFGSKYGALNEAELEQPLGEFRSINQLFTRGVRPELRPLPTNAESMFVSPCDGTVQTAGRIDAETVMRVKGVNYTLASLAPETDLTPYRRGHFAVLFLSPRDCHRIFSPQAGTLDALTHVPGYRLLVHPEHQQQDYPVFTLNERLIMELRTPLGKCLLIMVAGWGVGHITHPFPVDLKPRPRKLTRVTLSPPRTIAQGDWLATFELGSTAILITEASETLDCPLAPDQTVRYRESLFAPAVNRDSEVIK